MSGNRFWFKKYYLNLLWSVKNLQHVYTYILMNYRMLN